MYFYMVKLVYKIKGNHFFMDKRKIIVNAFVTVVAFLAVLLGAVSLEGINDFDVRGEDEPYSISQHKS